MNIKVITLMLLILALLFSGCAPEQGSPDPDISFVHGQTVIRMHQEAAPILTALGEPSGYTEETSCAFDGVDKTYHYAGFYLCTYPLEGKDYIYSLWFSDDTVATPEGIRIGSTREDAERAYPSAGWNDLGVGTVAGQDARLVLKVTDGAVSSIQYEALIQ